MNAQQQNRRCLTFKEKMQILKEVDQGLKTKEQIAAERGIVIGYVYRIIRMRATIESGSAMGADKRMIRSTQYQDIEEHLLSWLQDAQTIGTKVTGAMIKERAIDIAISMEFYKFPASNGWLNNFRKRYKLTKQNQLPKDMQQKLNRGEDIRQAIPKKPPKLVLKDIPTLDDAKLAHQILIKFFTTHTPRSGTFLALQQLGEAVNEREEAAALTTQRVLMTPKMVQGQQQTVQTKMEPTDIEDVIDEVGEEDLEEYYEEEEGEVLEEDQVELYELGEIK